MKHTVLSKKQLIILICAAAAALLTAVVCRAAFGGSQPEEPRENVSITGTWIDADAWENGLDDAVFLEFDGSGTLYINRGETPRRYKYESSLLTVYYPELDASLQTECSITGGFMRLDPRVSIAELPYGTIDFIHISEAVGLSDDELHEMY